ncbi:unnamed protein product [Brachionus calyciflorus]|uniref:VTT domain-containing protein n=1 Tax=Brachionus calyciflorus TaxID=104777 RepID=A0A814J7I1_9BILA|nr:unnamed protein product [Brachionus calyciflorus]
MNEFNDDSTKKKINLKNFSYFGVLTCLITLVLAFLFKDNFIYILSYLDRVSTSNIIEFHVILIVLFIGVSLPILWGYIVCVLILSYVYSFLLGFVLVSLYSSIGMSVAYFTCRYAFYECAHQRVKSVSYLLAISNLIESNDKGFRIIFLSRLMPIPFGLANTLFSVTDVDFKKYLSASVIGLMPSQLILCYMGSTLKSMTDVLVNDKTARTASLVFIAQLLIAIGVLYYILHAAKYELNKHLDNKNSNDPNVNDIKSCSICKNSLNCEHCQLIESV